MKEDEAILKTMKDEMAQKRAKEVLHAIAMVSENKKDTMMNSHPGGSIHHSYSLPLLSSSSSSSSSMKEEPPMAVIEPPSTMQSLDSQEIVTLQALAAATEQFDMKLTCMERQTRDGIVYSSASAASTVNYHTLESPGMYNFAPMSPLENQDHQNHYRLLTSSASTLCLDHVPRTSNSGISEQRQTLNYRVFSKSLVQLYNQVNAVPANEDAYSDRLERERFLQHHRYQVFTFTK